MKIDTIEKFKGSTWCVIFDDESRIYINAEVLSEYNLKQGMNLPQNAVDEIVYANDKRRARERALYLLSVRDHSFTELYKKLERNYDEQICLDVCNFLASKKIIDDRRYAERLARQLFEVKKAGKYKVRQEMRMKGLSDELIEEAIEKYEDCSSDLLKELVEKKYARYLTDEKGVRKVKSALVRQGYTFSEIKNVLDTYDYEDEDF